MGLCRASLACLARALLALGLIGLPAWGEIQENAVLKGHTAGVAALAISPVGDVLASASLDRTIKLWDLVNCRELSTLRGHTGEVRCLAFCGDGKQLVSGAGDSLVRLWQLPGGESTAFHGHKAPVLAVAVAPDSRSLVSSAADGVIQLWDLAGVRGGLFRSTAVESAGWLSFSPDGKWLAWPDASLVHIADVQTRRPLASLAGHTARVTCILFASGGRDLISASFDNTIRLWDPLAGTQRSVLFQGQSPIRSIACRSDGKLVAAAEVTGTLPVLELPSGRLQASATAPPNPSALVLSRSGRLLVSGHADGTIHVWQMPAIQPAGRLPPAIRPSVATRKWTSADGEYQIVAELVGQSGDQVTLRRTNGTEITLPRARLGRSDQDFLASLAAVQDEQAAVVLRRLGATVRTDGDKVLWVDFGGRRVRDESLAHLEKVPYLERLELAGSGVGDAALVHLKRLVRLKNLDLSGTQVSDAGVAFLKHLEALETLNLTDTLVSSAGLEQLRTLPRLKHVICSPARWKIEAGNQRGRLVLDMDRLHLVFDDIPMSRRASMGQVQVGGPGKASSTWRSGGLTVGVSYADGVARLEIVASGQKHTVQLDKRGTRLTVDGGRTFAVEGEKKTFLVRSSGVHIERN